MVSLARSKPPSREALEQIAAFMSKHKLGEDDLVNYGGAELKSPNQRIQRRARSVEKCWELMARLGVKAVDLDSGRAKT